MTVVISTRSSGWPLVVVVISVLVVPKTRTNWSRRRPPYRRRESIADGRGFFFRRLFNNEPAPPHWQARGLPGGYHLIVGRRCFYFHHAAEITRFDRSSIRLDLLDPSVMTQRRCRSGGAQPFGPPAEALTAAGGSRRRLSLEPSVLFAGLLGRHRRRSSSSSAVRPVTAVSPAAAEDQDEDELTNRMFADFDTYLGDASAEPVADQSKPRQRSRSALFVQDVRARLSLQRRRTSKADDRPDDDSPFLQPTPFRSRGHTLTNVVEQEPLRSPELDTSSSDKGKGTGTSDPLPPPRPRGRTLSFLAVGGAPLWDSRPTSPPPPAMEEEPARRRRTSFSQIVLRRRSR